MLSDPWGSGLAITNIEGLGPVSANISMTEITSMDGARYNSARIPSRNIVFTFVLGYFPTVEGSRNELYRIFPTKRSLSVEIKTDIRTYRTTGFVEAVDVDIFSSQESATVSILCPNPYFEAIDESDEFRGELSSAKSFEFPFSNESLDEKLIEFGNAASRIDFNVQYKGDVESGLTFHISVRNVTDWSYSILLSKLGTTDTMVLNLANLPGNGLQSNDEIIICTIPGQKRVTLVRNGVEYNAINTLQIDSSWLMVEPGDNIFRFNAPRMEVGQINLWFEYIPLYEGV
jgi:hypothetical protein